MKLRYCQCRYDYKIAYEQQAFLVADTQLYKSLCPSVGPSVRWCAWVEKCENAHFRPCPPVRNWYGRVSGLVLSQTPLQAVGLNSSVHMNDYLTDEYLIWISCRWKTSTSSSWTSCCKKRTPQPPSISKRNPREKEALVSYLAPCFLWRFVVATVSHVIKLKIIFWADHSIGPFTFCRF